MTRFEIRVVPHTSLYVGGYAQALGGSDGDTASDPQGLLLPGSAVKGALREAAVRLVQGAGRGSDLLATLFGADDQEGLLRVGTLRPEGPVGGEDGTVRNHVSLERATRQAAPQRLFQNRVTPARRGLSFQGILESREALVGDSLGLLLSAARITDQIGGGRGRGLGLVTVTLTELSTAEPVFRMGEESATRLVLVLEAEEAIHLSGVKDPSNYVASKDYLDGSTVRGAVARALGGRPADPEMELLFGSDAPAVFGDGRPGGLDAIPAPMTVQEPKRGGTPYDLAVRLCADACGGQPLTKPDDVRTARGTYARGAGGWFSISLKRRTVTRTARDAASGRGADGQLYSLEILDPVVADGQGIGKLRFYVPVTGTPEQLALVLRAADRGLAVGGDRSRGFGLLRLAEIVFEPTLSPIAERHRAWAEAVGRQSVPVPESTGVLLAVGPVSVSHARLQAALRAEGLELREGVERRQTHGGWNARLQLPRTLSSHYAPGSTFIVARPDGDSALPALARLEERGIGPGRADGWGLLVACHPIHLDPFQGGKTLSSLSPAHRRAIDLAKEDLVAAAEKLLESSGVRPDKDFGHSQLRNLGAVATETESPAVVLNFIRYQMGRDDKQMGWARGKEDDRVGDRFLADLGGDGGAISKALSKVKDWQDDPTRDQVARMELIRYFLGFATRYMKYLELKYPKKGAKP
jgi:CRISPR/Cas system CSM-associated protein Csm3 (group 7 of RAMP superfamily)